VRYRRQLELRAPEPIPLQKVKTPPAAPVPLDGPAWIDGMDDDEDLEHEDTAEWSDIDIDAS
jgi:hypothetical protein